MKFSLPKHQLKKLLKWGSLIITAYFLLTTLILGYQDTDYDKGIHKVYWSGLNALWKENKVFGIGRNQAVFTTFDGVDGPYIMNDSVFHVKSDNTLASYKLKEPKDAITVYTDLPQLPHFSLTLKKAHTAEPVYYTSPKKLIAISDIEGNLMAFYSFLAANKVIDKNGNWIFSDGHLVINGDVFDRGSQVTPLLWLIYKLEQEAELQGGKVHFIMGNHDIMNLYGFTKYNDPKYIHAAKTISGLPYFNTSLQYLYSSNSELGAWLRSKNIIEKIGDVLLVHGGLHTVLIEQQITLEEMNSIAKKYYGKLPNNTLLNKKEALITHGVHSPYWDRRLNLDLKHQMALKASGVKVEPTTQEELNAILSFYNAKNIIIGHSIVDDIQMDYNHKVIKIDVHHGNELNSGQTKGLYIEQGAFFKIDDKGNKEQLH